MAENEYVKLGSSELEKKARATHEMELDERISEVRKILEGYNESHKVQAEKREAQIKLEKEGKMGDLYEKVHKAHIEGGKLEYTAVRDFMGEFADKIIPVFYEGAKGGKTKDNLEMLDNYIDFFSQAYKKATGNDLRAEIQDAIANGDGEKAKRLMVEAIVNVKASRERSNFMDILLPPDHHDFKYQAGEAAEKEIKELVKDKGYEVIPGTVADNLLDTYETLRKEGAEALKKQGIIRKPKGKHVDKLKGEYKK